MSFPEDDTNWDSDIVFSQALLEQKLANSKRNNIHARYPDKDLADAFARLHGPDEYDDYDDDDETESTFISHHSDKLFVKERCDSLVIPGLDDYILGSPCSGVVTRLGTHKQVMDAGDWDEDIKLPLKGLPDSPLVRPPALDSLYLHDEPLPMSSPLQQKQQQQQKQHKHEQQQQQQPPQEPLTRKVRFLNMDQINTYTPVPQIDVDNHREGGGGEEEEKEDDDEEEGYDDIAFPEDMGGLAIKRPTSPTVSPPQQQQQQQQHYQQQKQQVPTLARSNGHEDDEEDFFKDIQIDSEDVFSSKKKTKPRLSSIPRRVPESKLPMPSLDRQHPRFRAATYASRQRQAAASNLSRGTAMAPSSKRAVVPEKSQHYHQQQQQLRLTAEHQQRGYGGSSSKNGNNGKMMSSANGTTLLFKPRTHVTYGNGSELDSLDILPDWRRRSLSCWKHLTEKRLGGVDPQRPWRHNMSRRKPTLIRPDDRALNKECNEMKYDAEKCRWQGNEKNVFSFASGSGSGSHENNNNNNNNNSRYSSSGSSLSSSSKQQRRRPALITNMNKKSHASKNAEGIVGSMVFDPVGMRWEKAPNVESDDDDDQDNALADIEDLGEFNGPTLYRDDHQQPHGQAPSLRVPLPNTMREFELSRQMKQLIQEQEEEHYERMKFWDLRREDEEMFVPIDTPVRAFTYLLYHTP